MGGLKVEIIYIWKTFAIYMNIKRFVLEFLFGAFVITVMLLAFQDYFMFIVLVMWCIFPIIVLSVRWRFIRVDRDRILQEIELEETYPFFYERFTKSE